MAFSLSNIPKPSRSAMATARSIALSRPGLIAIGAGTVGLGLVSSWGWLAAIGAAPFILAVLPCAAMCAMGLCMPMMGGSKKQASNAADSPTIDRADAPMIIEATSRRVPSDPKVAPLTVGSPHSTATSNAHDCCARSKENSHA